jgi:hypothetical protein
VDQHFYFIAISDRCCYKTLKDKLQHDQLRVNEGGAHQIRGEEKGVRGVGACQDPESARLVPATQIRSRVNALGVGGADQIEVVEEIQGHDTWRDPTSMRLGMAVWTRSASRWVMRTGSAMMRRTSRAAASSRVDRYLTTQHRRTWGWWCRPDRHQDGWRGSD